MRSLLQTMINALLPHPLRREPDERDTEEHVAGGEGDAALGLRPARRRRGARSFDRLLDYVEKKLSDAFAHLDNARADILAFTEFPDGLWQQIWSDNPNERLNREIRRRTDSVDILAKSRLALAPTPESR